MFKDVTTYINKLNRIMKHIVMRTTIESGLVTEIYYQSLLKYIISIELLNKYCSILFYYQYKDVGLF